MSAVVVELPTVLDAILSTEASDESSVPFLAEVTFMLFLAIGFAIFRRDRLGLSKKAKKSVAAAANNDYYHHHAHAYGNGCGGQASKADYFKGSLPMPRATASVIRELIASNQLEQAMRKMGQAVKNGYHVSSQAVTDLCRAACNASEKSQAAKVVGQLAVPLNADAAAVLLEDCLRRGDVATAGAIDDIARLQQLSLNVSSFDSLLKIYAEAGDVRALDRFEAMQDAELRISEGLCVGVVARCASSNFRRFAEAIADFSRARGLMSLNMYSALMKVYAYEGSYGKACALYDELRGKNLEADGIMRGCLMKFAMEAGRNDLVAELAERTSGVDIHESMMLIKSCGQTKDVKKAFEVFERLRKESSKKLDVRPYNMVLDVCASAGAVERAREFVRAMPAGLADEVTYNVLMKCYTCKNDRAGAEAVLQEMSSVGCKPSATTFNCLANMAASAGDAVGAWSVVDQMESAEVSADRYTISIMMKCVPRSADPNWNLNRCFALLERAGLDICGDDILFVTILETCIKQRKVELIEKLLKQFEDSSKICRASMQTHAVVIKGYGMTRQVDKCRAIFSNFVERRGSVPSSIMVGCMLDALVCNNCVAEAVALQRRLVAKGLKPNEVMYSMLMKGLMAEKDVDTALEILDEMKAENMRPPVSLYNCVMEAHSRLGKSEKVGALLEKMEAAGCDTDDTTRMMLVRGACAEGDYDKAVKLFFSLGTSRGTSSHTSAYNTLVSNCVQANRLDLSGRLISDMDKAGVRPTCFTLGAQIKHYGRTRCIEKAWEAVEKWPLKYKVFPNAGTKACLVRGCIMSNETGLALKVINDILKTERTLDAKTYRSLASSCVQGGLLDEAVLFVEAAYGIHSSGCRLAPLREESLGSDVLENLFEGLLRRGLKMEVALPLMQRLRAAQGGRFTLSSRLTAKVLS